MCICLRLGFLGILVLWGWYNSLGFRMFLCGICDGFLCVAFVEVWAWYQLACLELVCWVDLSECLFGVGVLGVCGRRCFCFGCGFWGFWIGLLLRLLFRWIW